MVFGQKKKKLLRIFLLSIRTCGSECMQARQCHLMQEGHTCECLRSCFLCGREVHAWPAGGRCGAARPLCGQAERTRRCMMHAGWYGCSEPAKAVPPLLRIGIGLHGAPVLVLQRFFVDAGARSSPTLVYDSLAMANARDCVASGSRKEFFLRHIGYVRRI
jgi:hypothetical protein